ncbi:MAG TPA: A24 family peptidase [Nitrospiraceae bacterium]|nr:A24 family peptidase [Nitrospiraceae bacterium]
MMWLYPGIALLLGLLIGSFLNVVIHRLPRKQSLIWPGSHCPACSASIGPWDNIPLLSYLVLRGCCRSCGIHITRRYPTVEAVNGLAYGLIVWYFGLGYQAVIYAAFFSALLVVSYIDLDYQIIPDAITLPGIALGVLAAVFALPLGLLDSLLGLLLGGGVLFGLAWISPYLFGKEGMGGGDIKLLAMIGAFLGWKPVLLTMLIGAILGAIVGVALIVLKVLRRDQYLPFGPFLAFGAIISMFFHQELFAWYIGFITRAH